jgi:alanine racemase
MSAQSYPNWLEIDLSAVTQNTREVLHQTGVPLMAVVKANAYGMGAVPVSRAMLAGGAEYLAVARGCEAMALRQAGIETPILLFGLPVDDELDELMAAGVTLTLTGFEAVELYTRRAAALGMHPRVHLKVDTGMGRFGVLAEEVMLLARRALQNGLELEGIYTHFAMIDSDPHAALNVLQLERFHLALAALASAGITPRWVHVANSAAALGHPETRFNMVRAGSAMLGIRPFYYAPFPRYLRRVLTWKTRLISCRTLPPGWGVSYGQAYHTTGEESIGVIATGYADGFRRSPHNEVLVNGRFVPVVGRVCADNCMLRLPQPLLLGSEVVLIGQQDGQAIQIEDLADRWNTAQADVVSAIAPRVERVYV